MSPEPKPAPKKTGEISRAAILLARKFPVTIAVAVTVAELVGLGAARS
jgi:hypothetical protein